MLRAIGTRKGLYAARHMVIPGSLDTASVAKVKHDAPGKLQMYYSSKLGFSAADTDSEKNAYQTDLMSGYVFYSADVNGEDVPLHSAIELVRQDEKKSGAFESVTASGYVRTSIEFRCFIGAHWGCAGFCNYAYESGSTRGSGVPLATLEFI